MKKQLFVFLLGILSASCMYAERLREGASAGMSTLPLIHNVMVYESISLAGDWNYIVDVQEEGYYDYRMNPTRWGFFNNAKPQRPEDLIEYDFDKSSTMRIPSDWNTQDERLFFYEGTVWFKKSFSMDNGKLTMDNYNASANHPSYIINCQFKFQENLYIENLAMLDKIEGLAGTTPWILKDFRSPRRVLPGIQDFYNMKGLVSDKGEKKKAFYVVKKWYEGK